MVYRTDFGTEYELEVQAPLVGPDGDPQWPFSRQWIFSSAKDGTSGFGRLHSDPGNTQNYRVANRYDTVEIELGRTVDGRYYEMSVDSAWNIMNQVQNQMEAWQDADPTRYDYEPGYNSNSFVNTLLYIIGVQLQDFNIFTFDYLDAVRPVIATNFPGSNENAMFNQLFQHPDDAPDFQLFGSNGTDFIFTGDGDDILYGFGGDDILVSEGGSDVLIGGDGADIIVGGPDPFFGTGPRSDTYVDSFDGGALDRLTGIERITGNGDGTWALLPSSRFDDLLRGFSDNPFGQRALQAAEASLMPGEGDAPLEGMELIKAGARDGSVELVGDVDGMLSIRMADGSGDILLVENFNWGDGAIGLDIGREEASIAGTEGRDRLSGTRADDLVVAGEGDDVVFGWRGDDEIAGGLGNDRIFGNRGDDFLYGDRGDDTLFGGQGDDLLWGGAGDDVLVADRGDDLVSGGVGNDTLLGGTGDDVLAGGMARTSSSAARAGTPLPTRSQRRAWRSPSPGSPISVGLIRAATPQATA